MVWCTISGRMAIQKDWPRHSCCSVYELRLPIEGGFGKVPTPSQFFGIHPNLDAPVDIERAVFGYDATSTHIKAVIYVNHISQLSVQVYEVVRTQVLQPIRRYHLSDISESTGGSLRSTKPCSRL